MTYNVILTADNGRFLAHVAELPDCKAEAESRDQVLALIKKRLEEFMQRSEIVQLKIPNLEKKSPNRNDPRNRMNRLKRQIRLGSFNSRQ